MTTDNKTNLIRRTIIKAGAAASLTGLATAACGPPAPTSPRKKKSRSASSR